MLDNVFIALTFHPKVHDVTPPEPSTLICGCIQKWIIIFLVNQEQNGCRPKIYNNFTRHKFVNSYSSFVQFSQEHFMIQTWKTRFCDLIEQRKFEEKYGNSRNWILGLPLQSISFQTINYEFKSQWTIEGLQ